MVPHLQAGGRFVSIRPEMAGDQAAIRHVNQEAFGSPVEADLVDQLRVRGVVTLSLVAHHTSMVMGHILFTPVEIVSNKVEHAAIALAPMAVRPEYQQQGIGSRLVEEGLWRLRAMGAEILVVLGHPEYYPRFGFVPARGQGILCPFDVPDDAFMVLELQKGALSGRDGTVRYQPEFLQL